MNKTMNYTNERNVQILISLLKAHGIKRVIASPGTTNMTFVGSIQNDPYFEIWSSVDERSAAYMACGMAAETGEPVVISCTGATASRNYMPGMTEAFYRKLPVLAVTSHRGDAAIGHLFDQQIDRRMIPNDVAVEKITLPMVDTSEDERYCEIEANKALLALKLNGGGPVHINMFTRYSQDFSVKELPNVSVINRYTIADELPPLSKGRIGVIIGSHKNFTNEETEALDAFCAANNAVIFCDHIGGYAGKYKINSHLVCSQRNYKSMFFDMDLIIHIGEVSATGKPCGKEVWRVSPDGAIRDTFRNVSKVFMMSEMQFFHHYIPKEFTPKVQLFENCKKEYEELVSLVPELPFGNVWVAKQTCLRLPTNSELHMGIFNSYRSWSFFNLPDGILGKCNVGGFGIDGGVSSMIGASLVNPDKLFFGVFGDLAFFYDMNVVGNRHIGNNVRIMLINNSRGTEFRLKGHPCSIFGKAADPYMAAAGHFGNQSPDLIKEYAHSLGYIYLSASNKEEFLSNIERFTTCDDVDSPMIFEIFTDTEDETDALEIMQTLKSDGNIMVKERITKVVKSVIGNNGVKIARKILGK